MTESPIPTRLNREGHEGAQSRTQTFNPKAARTQIYAYLR